MMGLKEIRILCSLLMISGLLNAQEKSAKLSLDKSEIKIGEQIEAKLQVVFPVTESYSFAQILDTLSGKIEVVDISPMDTSFIGSNLNFKTLTATLTLTSFDTGYHAVPPIYFPGQFDSLSTDPFLIHVLDVEVEMPENSGNEEPEIAIKDIKDIKDKDFSIWEWIKENKYTLLLILLFIAAIWSYIKYIHPRLKKKKISIIPAKRIVPPFEIAIQRLNDLDNKKLWQTGKNKEYYSELSDIVREYIEEQFNLPALESTTSEIIDSLIRNSFNENVVNEIKELFELSDLAKFAKFQPLGNQNQQSMLIARSFVEKTKPVEQKTEEHKEDV